MEKNAVINRKFTKPEFCGETAYIDLTVTDLKTSGGLVLDNTLVLGIIPVGTPEMRQWFT